MPDWGTLHRVTYAWGARPSGRALARALHAAGYDGPHVNFGWAGVWPHGGPRQIVNETSPVAMASNKRRGLLTLSQHGVSVPNCVFTSEEAQVRTSQGYTLIGRPDRHRAGSGWWECTTPIEVRRSALQGATHWLDYIPNTREFRVHIAFGQSIKLTEKLWSGTARELLDAGTSIHARNHHAGWHQVAPQPNAHRRTLRRLAKNAVQTLGLDYGAVDIITATNGNHYVLECNTAPNLTSATDTCARYTTAITNHGGSPA